jgi:hypothetical protein
MKNSLEKSLEQQSLKRLNAIHLLPRQLLSGKKFLRRDETHDFIQLLYLQQIQVSLCYKRLVWNVFLEAREVVKAPTMFSSYIYGRPRCRSAPASEACFGYPVLLATGLEGDFRGRCGHRNYNLVQLYTISMSLELNNWYSNAYLLKFWTPPIPCHATEQINISDLQG